MILTHPKNNSGFTLIEIMLAMTIFAIVMTSVLLSIENLSIARVKTENRVNLLEELYFFSEQLIVGIKDGGTLDYEEYWNRNSYNNTILSGTITSGQIGGAYTLPTGVGNYGFGGSLGTSLYGGGLYYCVSGNSPASRMGTGGCLSGFNNPGTQSGGVIRDYKGSYQRYGQYILQYTDYNSNTDGDGGDEDGIATIVGDEDDKDIGNGPSAFSGATPELYLINPIENTRSYFRFVVRQDPDRLIVPCQITATGLTNEGCMGNVQVLKMRGVDIGYPHLTSTDETTYDGNIDTWFLHPDWTGSGVNIAGGQIVATGSGDEWVDLFPNSINVKSLKFTSYPEKDPWISWDAPDVSQGATISPFIHPYVRLQMTVGFSWGKRRALKNDDPTISINTTITLGDKE